MNLKKIYIFHEQGTQSHYRALKWKAEHNPQFKIIFREFSITKKFAKAIYHLDVKLFVKQFINLAFIISLPFKRKTKIIVGIAPYDWRLIIYYQLLKRHTYFYHTSKTTWGYKNYSKKFLAKTRVSENIWKKFIENSRGIFCVSNQSANELQKYYDTLEISVVNHAVPEVYSTKTINNKTEFSNKINCLFVGRYSESKGIRLIFDIIKSLPKDEFKFTFVGKGELESKITQFCNKHKNCNNTGFKSSMELLKIYDETDILLLPSIKTGPWEEFFGIVLIEALARGVVPIATNHTGPKEIITNNKNGFIFIETEYVEKSKSLLLNLKNNPKDLEKLKIQAFKKGQIYSPSEIFTKWETILNK